LLYRCRMRGAAILMEAYSMEGFVEGHRVYGAMTPHLLADCMGKEKLGKKKGR
jgi:hypothetical protein